MTIKEALSIKTKPLTISSDELDLYLLEAGMDGTANYDPIQQGQEVDMIWAGLLLTTIQIVEVKEDDVSIKYSVDLKGMYSAIMRKWGLPDPFLVEVPKPTVKQVNFFG